MFKTKLSILFFICAVMYVTAQVQLPALSPRAKVFQQAGLTELEVSYSRPNAKSRVLFSDKGLVPFGEFWRTGANAATRISFNTHVFINDTELKKGDYAMLTKPNRSSWEIYFYAFQTSSWNDYVSQTPVTIAKVNIFETLEYVESFTIAFENITFDSVDLTFVWGKTKVALPIQLPTKEASLKNIERMVKGPSNNDYFQAALYLHESKSDLNTSLEYIQKVTQNEKAQFFQVYREAVILRDLHRKKEALAAAKRSLQLSEKVNNTDFIKLNQDLIKELNP